jgi:class 3 adenylate cyclase
MSAATIETPELQLAHVLFMDIVGYSRLDPSAQLAVLQELQELVRSQPEIRKAGAGEDLLCLPTGDGMALVFFREPVAPLQCAVQIARALRNRTDLQLRMGIHSGPVYRLEDINAHANVSGGGINLAQRVMDCGDAGHILLSRATAELIGQVGAWPLEDLGECEVKHGRVYLYNFYTRECGNPERPARLRRTLHLAATGVLMGQKIVLLYRRDAQPDMEVLAILIQELEAQGCDVFWDRRVKVGMKWAEEIARRIREADAVIPLVSEGSMHSEMLAEELQIAREAAGEDGARPRILPVRIRYSGSLPEGAAAVLDPLEHTLWETHSDTERVLRDLLEGLAAPEEEFRAAAPERPLRPAGESPPSPEPAAPAPQAAATAAQVYGGAMPLDSPYYVQRSSDAGFLGAIARQDSIVLVKGARQMGKTSLLARGLQQAREAGVRVALTDLQWLNAEQLASPDALFMTLGEALADQLDLDTYPDAVWNPRSGASVNFQRFMRRAILREPEPLVWGLDEVDRLFSTPYAAEVFGLFRSWHNARALDPTGPWARLTLAIAYATEAHLFITDVNQSPFNVGTRVSLADFTPEQVADLNRRHGNPLRGSADLDRFYSLVHGHPYLVQRSLHELAATGLPVAEFEQLALSNEGPLGDHLRRLLMLLAREPRLREAVVAILRGEPLADTDSFYRLRSAGLITGDAPRLAQPRCRLYTAYLEQHLL